MGYWQRIIEIRTGDCNERDSKTGIKPSNSESLVINSNTTFKDERKEIWVESNQILYGIITDWGGDSVTNIHFKTDKGTSFKIDCAKSDIENEKNNRVYQPTAINVTAEQNLITGELRKLKFKSFLNYNPKFDEQQLLTLFEKGREAWKDIPDHVSWIRNMRSEHD